MTEIAVPAGAEGVVRAYKFRPAEADGKPVLAAGMRRLAFKSMAEFCAEYVPLSYAVDPIVRSSSIYTLTAKTGAGKTAWLVIMALAIATGRSDILGFDVPAGGRVAYLAFENPDDVRMRLKIAAYKLNIDPRIVAERLVILDVRAKPEEVIANLAMMSEQPFSIIIADTLAAFFDGKDINDNVQGGEFMRRLRPATLLPGRPSVLVAAHPVKNASDDQLVPYGGDAILNEVDGNLILRNDAKIVTLHWQGKLRGLEFAPKPFRLEICDSPKLVDAKGRRVQLPVMRPVTRRGRPQGSGELGDRAPARHSRPSDSHSAALG
jgi:hypothetical protein